VAREFDGASGMVAVTLSSAITTGDFSIGCWFNADTAGEGTAGRIWYPDAGNDKAALLVANTNTAIQFVASAGFQSIANTTLSLGNWQCVVGRYNDSTGAGTIILGSLSAAMAAATLTTNTTDIAGTVSATGYLGNQAADDRTFDGRIARFFIVPWLMTVPECESYRQGNMGVLYAHGTPRLFLPLTSPTAASAEDLSGNAASGTVTSATAAEDPPVPFRWAG
jgi:hypothetical protein